MEREDISYRGLEKMTGTRHAAPEFGPDAYSVTPNPRVLMVALQKRGYYGKIALARFEIWLVGDRKRSPATAKRKRRLVWGCRCDYPDEPWNKVLQGFSGDRCRGVKSRNYTREIRVALRDYAEFLIEDPASDDEERDEGRALLVHLRYRVEDSEVRIALRSALAGRGKSRSKALASPLLSLGLPALPVSTPLPLLLPASPAQPSSPPPPPPAIEISHAALNEKNWLNYAEAAVYCGRSLGTLRNLVSADAIPVYGGPRSRKFRRDMLDLWMTNRDLAMRKFRLEREAQDGD